MSSKPGYILPPPHQDFYYHFFIDILAQLQRKLFASNLSKEEFTLYYTGPFKTLLPYFCDDIRPRETAPKGTPVLPKKGGLFWKELREIRSVLTAGMPVNEPKLITLVRRTTTRQLNNHWELKAVLQQFGAEVVDVDTAAISFEDQIRLFSNSKLVVAAHGSALTNILFMQPGTSVVEINPDGFTWYEYQKICDKLGLRHHFLDCDAEPDLAIPDDLVDYIGHRPPYLDSEIRALRNYKKRRQLSRFIRDNSVMHVAPLAFKRLIAETIGSQRKV